MPSASIMAESVVTVPRPERAGLRTRIATAAVLAPIAIAAEWAGGFVWIAAVTIMAVIALWEWARMAAAEASLSAVSVLVVLTAASVPLLAIAGPAIAGALVAVCAVAGAIATARRQGGRQAIWLGVGTAYIALAAMALAWLREAPGAGFGTLLWILVAVWASDAGAYAVGRAIGGPRLAPRLSPNKTWSGLGGAVLGPLVASALMALIWPTPPSFLPLTIAAILVGVVGQVGDLLESAGKRHFGRKDSGTLIPGHGGVLDRVDALMAVGLLVALYSLAGGRELSWSS